MLWLVVCILLTYAPDIGRGFVADDFGWISFSRIDSFAGAWTLLVEGAPGFYRPIVALSFGLNELLFGMSPAGYALTNLAMAFAIVIGLVWLGTSLRLPAVAGVFGAGLWVLNFHGISSALIWISGRTSLLTTLFAVFGAVALVRGRSIWAGWLTFASLMSKEEPILLPVIFALWLWIDRRPLGAIVQSTWPSFVALGAYLALRARTDAFTPATAPSFYRLSASPDVILPNALSYLDRSMTFTAAVLLLGLIAFGRLRATPLETEWRTAAKGAVWLVLGFAVTILIPVRSSLYVVFPTVGFRVDRDVGGRLVVAIHPRTAPPSGTSRDTGTAAPSPSYSLAAASDDEAAGDPVDSGAGEHRGGGPRVARHRADRRRRRPTRQGDRRIGVRRCAADGGGARHRQVSPGRARPAESVAGRRGRRHAGAAGGAGRGHVSETVELRNSGTQELRNSGTEKVGSTVPEFLSS